ncbi:MAG TPA: hypothetical protein DCL55_10555, partial [Brevundimonas sp.]|nr:hypothetical protein [Brevundimonas sp.]
MAPWLAEGAGWGKGVRPLSFSRKGRRPTNAGTAPSPRRSSMGVRGRDDMRSIVTMTTVAACGLMLKGCATTGYGDYASACERDYARNRELATGAGAALGAAVGAAVAGEGNREEGAAIGAIAGALIGRELSEEEDPCGYGFGGYNDDYRYGRERVYWR